MDASCNSYTAAVGPTTGVKLQRVVRIAECDGCCATHVQAADIIIIIICSSSSGSGVVIAAAIDEDFLVISVNAVLIQYVETRYNV